MRSGRSWRMRRTVSPAAKQLSPNLRTGPRRKSPDTESAQLFRKYRCVVGSGDMRSPVLARANTLLLSTYGSRLFTPRISFERRSCDQLSRMLRPLHGSIAAALNSQTVGDEKRIMVASARMALRSLISISSRKEKPRVVLLQGPVGPFFRCLHRFLEQRGYEALRICFDAGDRFFALGTKSHAFGGGPGRLGGVVLRIRVLCTSGPSRLFRRWTEVHRVARAIAEKSGVNVIALEEGYIRPGFVTVERGGNNAASPIAGLMPPDGFDAIAAGYAAHRFQGLQPHVFRWLATTRFACSSAAGRIGSSFIVASTSFTRRSPGCATTGGGPCMCGGTSRPSSGCSNTTMASISSCRCKLRRTARWLLSRAAGTRQAH